MQSSRSTRSADEKNSVYHIWMDVGLDLVDNKMSILMVSEGWETRREEMKIGSSQNG